MEDKNKLSIPEFYFAPTNNPNFTIEDIRQYKKMKLQKQDDYIISYLNDKIIKKINAGPDEDGIVREYIAINMKLSDYVIEHFKHRQFRVNVNKSSHSEEVYLGGLKPEYYDVTDYTTIIAWDVDYVQRD